MTLEKGRGGGFALRRKEGGRKKGRARTWENVNDNVSLKRESGNGIGMRGFWSQVQYIHTRYINNQCFYLYEMKRTLCFYRCK